MRKVLIITYYWPPSGGAGVQRWLKFVKYLRLYDWEPVIYTPSNPEFPALDESLLDEVPADLEIIKTPIWEPYQLYKKLAGYSPDQKVNASGFISEKKKPGKIQQFSMWLRGNFFIPDARKFWIKPSIKFLTEWLKTNKVDAMVSTGPPHSMHMIALGVKNNTGLPWLADFRDPWTNIDFYHELMLSKRADKQHHEQELKVLSNADNVVVISNSMKTDFLKIKDRDYAVITNGFDYSDIENKEVITDPKFSLAHIGSMAKSRNPENLWKALADLKERIPGLSDDLVIKLVGSIDIAVINSLEKYNLTANLEKIEYRPHDEIIAIQQQSRVLLLVINDTPNSKVILPGKFFEYMASGRPILCIGPIDGDAAEIIHDTHAGVVADTSNYDEIREKISSLYHNYRSGNDVVKTENISRFSRKELTKTMAATLENMVLKNEYLKTK